MVEDKLSFILVFMFYFMALIALSVWTTEKAIKNYKKELKKHD